MAATLSPFVYWGQRGSTVSLKVDLRNVENEEVTLMEGGLTFAADGLGVKGLNKYSFDLKFYQQVNPEKSRYRKTDLAVEFQIEKDVDETWPRLTTERLKLPWLKIDFDKFPLDDSESESENTQSSQEDMIKKITTELKAPSPPEKSNVSSMKENYLLLYNLFQGVGYTYMFIVLMFKYITIGESAKEAAFETSGTQMMVCQLVALLEVVHASLGLVRSNTFMTLVQVLGRNFILFMLILQEPKLQISSICWYLFVVWSSVEVIRYPFYILQILGFQVKIMTWLRYSIWIPLYPLGILIEVSIIIKSITYFSDTGFFSFALPNSANLAFYFPYFLMLWLLPVAIGATNNLNHMRLQRKKQLGRKSKTL